MNDVVVSKVLLGTCAYLTYYNHSYMAGKHEELLKKGGLYARCCRASRAARTTREECGFEQNCQNFVCEIKTAVKEYFSWGFSSLRGYNFKDRQKIPLHHSRLFSAAATVGSLHRTSPTFTS